MIYPSGQRGLSAKQIFVSSNLTITSKIEYNIIMSKFKNYLLIAVKRGYKINKNGIVKNPEDQYVEGSISTDGYKKFGIRIKKTNSATIFFHRLQGYQKFGQKIFEDNIEVRHLDGDKLNNEWDNIRIGTHSDNLMDMDEEIRIEKAKHASSFIQKHDHEEIKEYYNNNDDVSYNDVMKKFDISSKGTVSYIINK